MKEITDQELFDIAPEFFKHKDDGQRSLMVFGFAIGQGWRPLVRELLEHLKHQSGRWKDVCRIRDEAEAKGEDWRNFGQADDEKNGRGWIVRYFEENPTDPFEHFEVVQVKEKFGGLRFYVEGCQSPEVVGAIPFAASLSYSICEVCGSMADVTTKPNGDSGWVVSWCESCRRKKQ